MSGDRATIRRLRVFFRQAAMLMQAGLQADRTLDLVARQRDDKALAALAGRLAARLRLGDTLSAAMAAEDGVFDGFDQGVVRAAEASGRLPEGFARLADHQERRHALAEKLRSALTYPAILTVAAGAALAVLFIVVVPRFEPMILQGGGRPPMLTVAVFAISRFLVDWGWLVAAGLGGAVFAAVLPAARARLDRALLVAPMIGRVVVTLEAARWTRALGILVENGVGLPDALRIAAGVVGNGAVRAAAAYAAAGIGQGRGLAVLLAEGGCFPSVAIQLVRVGEETGGLGPMLARAADYHEAEAQAAIDRAVALIEPAVVLVLGLAVAVVVFALLITVSSLNDLVL